MPGVVFANLGSLAAGVHSVVHSQATCLVPVFYLFFSSLCMEGRNHTPLPPEEQVFRIKSREPNPEETGVQTREPV